MSMPRSERIITRLEKAGGAVSESVDLLNQIPGEAGPIANRLMDLNIMIADARRAMIKIQNGEDVHEVARWLELQYRETLG